MWDAGIRVFYLKKKGYGADYFDFLCEMQLRLKELSPAIRELEKEFGKRATRFIDEYNWKLAHP
jgi:hypothetical protein